MTAEGRWKKSDKGVRMFYIYVLGLKNGTFYVGQTNDLRARILEHRTGQVPSTRNMHAKLLWFRTCETRSEAVKAESHLKVMLGKNPRRIRKMILEFQDLVNMIEIMDWQKQGGGE